MYQDIKSFDDACKALSIENTLPDFTGVPDKHRKALLSHYQLVIIAQALNERWEPNWDDYDEYKYYPYFNMQGGFSYYYYGSWITNTNASSRLCFRSREVAKYAGETFLELFKDYFVIDK